jgi:UDP-glucose 4-epimerase
VDVIVVVTGGSGQLGSLVIEEIISEHDVVSIDLRDPHDDLGQEHLRGDIRDPEMMRNACKGADAIIHLAAQVSVVRSTEDPDLDLDINVRGTLNMLSSALKEEVPLFIHISTAAVYGDPIHLPVDEGHPTSPKSFYGTSKLSAEHYVRAFKECLGLDHIIIRPFNMYSPRADPSSPYSGVITKFVEAAKSGTPLRVDGDGKQTRDFIHARDVATMIQRCLVSKARNLTLNCASGRGTSINELVEAVSSVSPSEVRLENGPARAGDIRHSVGDDSKARGILGFTPRIGLQEGIADFF